MRMTSPRGDGWDVEKVRELGRCERVPCGVKPIAEGHGLVDDAHESLPFVVLERCRDLVDVVQLRPPLKLSPREDEGAQASVVGSAGRLPLEGADALASLVLPDPLERLGGEASQF